MNVFTSSSLLVLSAVLLTVALIACALAPPMGIDSRDAFVLAIGACGLVLGGLAFRRFLRIHHALMRTASR